MHDDRERLDASRLIAAVANERDREAFKALFEHYAPRLKGYLMRSGTGAAAAEELAQETMLTVWRKAPSFDAGRATASAWVFTIARNLRVDSLRRERVRLYEPDPSDAPTEPDRPDDVVTAGERDMLVRQALTALPSEQLRIVELSFFEDTPHGEIASRLGVPLGTVKSRLRLAMRRLRDILADAS